MRETPRPSCRASENLPSEFADGSVAAGSRGDNGRDAIGFAGGSGGGSNGIFAAPGGGAAQWRARAERGRSLYGTGGVTDRASVFVRGLVIGTRRADGRVRRVGCGLKSMTSRNGLYSVKTL